jgi:hypothetical protein
VSDHVVEGTFAAAQVIVTIEGVFDLFERLQSCGSVRGSSRALLRFANVFGGLELATEKNGLDNSTNCISDF